MVPYESRRLFFDINRRWNDMKTMWDSWLKYSTPNDIDWIQETDRIDETHESYKENKKLIIVHNPRSRSRIQETHISDTSHEVTCQMTLRLLMWHLNVMKNPWHYRIAHSWKVLQGTVCLWIQETHLIYSANDICKLHAFSCRLSGYWHIFMTGYMNSRFEVARGLDIALDEVTL